MSLKSRLATAALIFAGLAGSATAGVYEINWSGSSSLSLRGILKIQDGLEGIIDETRIESLAFTVYQGNAAVGSRFWSNAGADDDGDPNHSSFNLNFDVTRSSFLLGGDHESDTGQSWFIDAAGDCSVVGFGSTTWGQGVCFQNTRRSTGLSGPIVFPEQKLTATRLTVPVVPLPMTGLLLLTATGAFAAMRRRSR